MTALQPEASAQAPWTSTMIGVGSGMVAVLNNGLGRYPAALAGARLACQHDDLGYFNWSLAELVEAAFRSGAVEEAAAALRQLEERTQASGTDWALGVLARSKALLSGVHAAEPLYREAIERLERDGIVIHLGRAHLLYGEWLRRVNRRHDGREHLRLAYQTFSGIGAEAFAERARGERARGELLATGETVRKRTVESRDVLTARDGRLGSQAQSGRYRFRFVATWR
jgi:tetratricopeptide (TPR) repeat protein